MVFSGLWSRKSTPKEKRPEASPPSHLPETHWTRGKSKLRHRRDNQAVHHITRLDATMSTETPTDGPKRRLLRQIISLRPSVPPPPQSTTNRRSEDKGNQAANSHSYRQVPQDSSISNFVPEYEYVALALTRAKTSGEARSAERRTRTLDLDANAGERVEARSSHQLPPVPSSNPGLIERCEIPPRELSSTDAPELMNPSPWYKWEVPSECLSTGSMSQARRRRLRAQIRRARLVAEDLASPGFSLDNLSILDSASPGETDGVAVNDVHASASNTEEPVVAAARTAPDADLYETSPESIVQTAPSDVQFNAQSPQFLESFDTETTDFHSTSRDSRASSSSSHSIFEFDHLFSHPARTVENLPSLNPAKEEDVEHERSVYDPVHQWFSVAKLNTQRVTSSADISERKVDSGWIESAGGKEESFVPVAPTLPARVSHPEDGKVVTLPTPSITVRPQYPQRQRSTNDRMIDPDGSHRGLPYLSPSRAGSAEADGRDIDTEWVKSAGEIEARSSFPAAPIPPTAVMRIDACDVLIRVTPPSPPTTVRPSLSHKYAKELGMNPDDSHPVPRHPALAGSTPQNSDHCLGFQRPATFTKPSSVKNYSRPFRHEPDQHVSSAAFVSPSKPADPELFTSLIQGETEAHNVHVKSEPLSTTSPFGPSGETEEQLTFFDMLALSGTIDKANKTVDEVGDASAVDEAEPSISVEPVPALLTRKSAKVNRATEKPMPRPILDRVRALTSQVTPSLRKWCKTASRSFVRRSAQPEGNAPFNPDFNSLEGFVPSRGSSPDCIGLNDALALPKSNLWNTSATKLE